MSAAFLSGRETQQEIYVRAHGLPSTKGTSQGMCAYESSEVDLRRRSATGVVPDKTGEIYALCGLRADDGMLSGNPKDPRFIKLKKEMDSRFNIKEWLELVKAAPVNLKGGRSATSTRPSARRTPRSLSSAERASLPTHRWCRPMWSTISQIVPRR